MNLRDANTRAGTGLSRGYREGRFATVEAAREAVRMP